MSAGVGRLLTGALFFGADLLMWKYANGAWHRISNTTSTRIAATSNGAGRYVVAVRSAGGAAQSCSLSLDK